MNSIAITNVICNFLIVAVICTAFEPPYVKRYSKLHYDTSSSRHKRDVDSTYVIPVRHQDARMVLRLRPAAETAFGFGSTDDNLSHLVEGVIDGDPNSHVYGSVLDGIFAGHIHTGSGKLYHVDKISKFLRHEERKRPINAHSIIYLDEDIDFEPYEQHRRKRSVHNAHDSCGLTEARARQMEQVARAAETQAYTWSADEDLHHDAKEESVNERYRRQTPPGTREDAKVQYINERSIYDVRMCSLYMQADHYLYNEIFSHEGQRSDTRTREEINSMFYSHVKMVNKIYERTSFSGITGINFIIQRTTIYAPDTCKSGTNENPFCEDGVDVSEYLNLNSVANHSAFCLAYALTYRDFDSGTLGLAWVASPQPNTAGGICQVYQKYNERRGWVWRSLNTGIITLVNYKHRVPVRVSQLTLAHEIGHNFGSPHDYPEHCQPGLPNGNYIMYASATSGDKPNNEEFSACSKANISAVLFAVLSETPVDPQRVLYSPSGGKRNCFSARTTAFCGNQIVEPGEECDCGFEQADCDRMRDSCCHPHKTVDGKAGCTRKNYAKCSPSEGPCCDADTCNYKGTSNMCSEEDECNMRQTCSGRAAKCPRPPYKPDNTTCKEATKVCSQGVCNRSICLHVGLEDCFITGASAEAKCMLACKTSDGICRSSADMPQLEPFWRIQQAEREAPEEHEGHTHGSTKGIELQPGSPCDNYRGYCDFWRNCIPVESEGAISKFLSESFLKWVVRFWRESWWIVLLVGLAFMAAMALFIKCCAVHTPSTNPNKPPPHNIYETLRHPSTLIRRHRSREPRQGQSQSRDVDRRHRRRRRDGSAGPSTAGTAVETAPGTSSMQAPIVPPAEPPPPYLAVDPSSAPHNALPKRGHRRNRKPERANLVEMKPTRT